MAKSGYPHWRARNGSPERKTKHGRAVTQFPLVAADPALREPEASSMAANPGCRHVDEHPAHIPAAYSHRQHRTVSLCTLADC